MKQTFSIDEVESAKNEGWVVVKENVIAGKIRSVVMEKEVDNPCKWIDDRNKERDESYSKLSKTDQRIRRERDMRYSRGLE